MILSSHVYNKILEFIDKSDTLDGRCFDSLFQTFPNLERTTLASILHNYIKKKTITNTRRLKNDITDIIDTFKKMIEDKKQGVFLFLAEKYRVTPVCIARQVLEFYEYREDGKNKKKTPKELLWDSSLISNGALGYEVHLASLFDSSYSQIANIVASLSGVEYEKHLQSCLLSYGLSFKTENELRCLNFAKTPDILLEVPFAINNMLIKWIESKACFGDETIHEDYFQLQYKHYFRFGAGIVIYWFGFVRNIKSVNKNLLICDGFPTNIVKIS